MVLWLLVLVMFIFCFDVALGLYYMTFPTCVSLHWINPILPSAAVIFAMDGRPHVVSVIDNGRALGHDSEVEQSVGGDIYLSQCETLSFTSLNLQQVVTC